MARGPGPSVRARRLASELRRLRMSTGLTTDAAGERAGMSGAKVSRIENNRQSFTRDDVAALLDAYGLQDDQRGELLDMAERAHELGWWKPYERQLTKATPTLLALEMDATRLRNFEPTVLPGLLQTPEYARQVLRTTGPSVRPEEIEARVAARMARQAILTKPKAPSLQAVIDEAVLRRLLASPDIAERQFRHLLDAADRPNVLLQVIPLTAGIHTGVEGPFLIFEYGNSSAVVLLEAKAGEHFLEKEPEVAPYLTAITSLEEQALDAAESRTLVARLLKELR
ncbi:transcriptional regulator [Longimycelium tulufanense]|uniref:Transcriptional regulator n=2 Tax=Longimycelium tulufanense TaxID=907463 RepID=A0A8J3C624_9PSEU|nr:transcriptional regulator [Longimycelium tulufanense]